MTDTGRLVTCFFFFLIIIERILKSYKINSQNKIYKKEINLKKYKKNNLLQLIKIKKLPKISYYTII